MFDDLNRERRFRDAWESITIARSVTYSLFTFGESTLPYYLVLAPRQRGETVTLIHGEIRVTRPLIITPGDSRPEFRNFFEEHSGEEMIEFLMARTAAFSNLRLDNKIASSKIVSDSVEEVVASLNRRLDDEEEDQIAILTAPHDSGGVARLRYAAERILASAPDNLQELRERGFLP